MFAQLDFGNGCHFATPANLSSSTRNNINSALAHYNLPHQHIDADCRIVRQTTRPTSNYYEKKSKCCCCPATNANGHSPRIGNIKVFGCPVSFRRHEPSHKSKRIPKKQQTQRSSKSPDASRHSHCPTARERVLAADAAEQFELITGYEPGCIRVSIFSDWRRCDGQTTQPEPSVGRGG